MTYSENQVCDTIMIAIQALEALHTECELREQAERNDISFEEYVRTIKK